MKVALLIDTWFPFIGGGQINAWEISKRIANEKIKINIITRNCGEDNLEKVPYLEIYKLGSETRPDSIISKFYFLFNLFFFVLKRDYDLIHVHPFLPAPVAKLLSVLKNVPIILTVHGTRLFEPKKKTPSRLLEKYILTGIRYDTQISVTRAFLKIPNVNKNILVIPNGIDVQKFTKVKVAKFSKPTILWVGRFDPVKRVEDLIMAVKILTKRIKTLQLLLVGYGYQKDKLEKLAEELKLPNARFLGFQKEDDLAVLYKKSHVFVLPSSSEGQPLTILEAQAASLPVVATNIGGIPEIIKDGENGYLIKPKNVHELAGAIAKAIFNRELLSKNASKNIKANYNWDDAARKTKKLYISLINLNSSF